MNKEMKERIVKIIKTKYRLGYVPEKELLKFVKENIDSNVPNNVSGAKLIEMAEEYLNEETLERFYSLDRFGLAKGDLGFACNISQKKVNELIDNEQIRIKNIIPGKIGRYKIKTYICCIEDALRLEGEGKLVHKKNINREIREFELTDENLAEALYVINKSAKVSRDTKNESYYEGNHRVCHAQKTREQKIYELKDAVLKKMIKEGRAKYIGFNPKGCSCMKLYQIATYTFHQAPICYSPEDPELNENYRREEIKEYISAEKKETNIKYIEAVPLLQKYLNENKI